MSPNSFIADMDASVFRSRPNDDRLHGLDWLRAGAAVLVVTLHAGIAYLAFRMPGLTWSTNDPVGSPTVDAITWWINGFIMPLFFVQSGFLACPIMRAKGADGFLRHRTRRLLAPFALGCVLILPLDLYAWLLGWAGEGKITLHKLRSLKIDSPLGDNLWGISHLWFLEYLWVFCVGAWAWLKVAEWQNGRVSKAYLSSPVPLSHFATVPLLTISTFALWWEPQLVIGFRHCWWPLAANLLFYAPWFAMGWVTFASRDSLRVSTPHGSGERRLIASLAVFILLLPLIRSHVTEPMQGMMRLTLAMVFMLHAWLAVTGWLGVCLHWLNRKPPASVKYVAEASFWIYLLHHPVVGLTQVSLSQAALPVALKFLLTTLAGLALPLLTYHAFVRQTWVGVVLSGRRLERPSVSPEAEILPFPLSQPERLRKSA